MSRIRRSNIDATGSGGVLDGTILKGPTQVDKTLSNSTATLLYTVVNDCCLYMECADLYTAGADIECHYWLDSAMTKPIFKTTQTNDAASNPYKYQGTCVPLKAGSQIYGSAVDNTTQTRRFNFVEYRLSSLAPQIAMPDYNKMATLFNNRVSPRVNLFDGTTHKYTIPENGYVRVFTAAGTGIANPVLALSVNDIGIYSNSQTVDSEDVDSNFMTPVSKGDVLKLAFTSGAVEIYFFPAKAVQAKIVNGLVSIPDWDTSKKVDVSSVMTDNTWTAPADGWLTGNFHDESSSMSSGVTINGARVFYELSEHESGPFVIPLAKNDVVRFTGQVTYVLFYPAKHTQLEVPDFNTIWLADLYIVGSDGVLRNRAVNQVTLTGNTTLKLPAAVTGKVRDFVVDVDVSTAGTITWQNSDGTSFTSYMYDKARGSNPLTETLTAGSTYQFYFTERRTGGSFRVELSELESPT